MSQPQKVHLFNCDRTYKFDAVEGLLEATKAKGGFDPANRHYFSLGQMSEMTTKTIPKLQMDLAFFVVHAHESRLSINEDNAGIGYAKIYRALLEATGEKVIIVIGGDDNYKNEDEEDQVVISRWAKRKISSQFKDEFLDGRKSFIFSWNKKHRAIHEEALLHYFDPNKKGQKFEYQPEPKERESSKSAQYLRRGQSMEEERREDKSFIPSNKAGEKRDAPQDGATSSSHTTGGFHPLQSDANFPQKTGDNYQPSSHTTGGFDPLQPHADFSRKREGQLNPSLSDTSSATRDKPSFSSEKVGERKTHPLSTKKQKDLAVLGWEANPELMLKVTHLILRHRHELKLAEEPENRNTRSFTDLTSYLENNSLKFCVLLVDAEKVGRAVESSPELEADYLKLLETAERNVAAKVIIIVCCQLSFPREEEDVFKCTIKSKFKDEDKVIITSFQGGKIDLEPKLFLEYLMSPMPNTNPDPQERSSSPQILAHGPTEHPSAQQSVPSLYPALTEGNKYNPYPPGIVANQPSYPHAGTFDLSAPQNPAYDPSQHLFAHQSDPSFNPAVTAGSQFNAYPHGKVASQPSYPHVDTLESMEAQAPAKTLMLNTHLRNGRISNRPEDIVYWKPGWVVPDYIEKDLFPKHFKTSDAELVILSDEKGKLTCQVNEKKSSDPHPEIAPGETIKLKTRMHCGHISFEAKDVEIFDKPWRVPKDLVDRLWSEYRTTPNAKLFIVSDSKDNLRHIVQVGTVDKVSSAINKKVGTNAFF